MGYGIFLPAPSEDVGPTSTPPPHFKGKDTVAKRDVILEDGVPGGWGVRKHIKTPPKPPQNWGRDPRDPKRFIGVEETREGQTLQHPKGALNPLSGGFCY